MRSSPKPDLPAPSAYDPPPQPNMRDLGPPPPGYGRYADFEPRNAGTVGSPFNTTNLAGLRRNLDDVLCFKVCRTVTSPTK